jgi:hypothetical protein
MVVHTVSARAAAAAAAAGPLWAVRCYCCLGSGTWQYCCCAKLSARSLDKHNRLLLLLAAGWLCVCVCKSAAAAETVQERRAACGACIASVQLSMWMLLQDLVVVMIYYHHVLSL